MENHHFNRRYIFKRWISHCYICLPECIVWIKKWSYSSKCCDWHHLLICISNLEALKPIKVYTPKISHRHSKWWFFKCISSFKYGVMLDVSMWNFRKLISKTIYSRISPRSFQASSHKLRRDSLCLCRAKRSFEKYFFRLVKFRPVFFGCFSVRRNGF